MNNSKIKKDIEQMILMVAIACIIAALLLGIALYASGRSPQSQDHQQFQELKIITSSSFHSQKSITESSLPDRFLLRFAYLIWWTDLKGIREGGYSLQTS